VFIIVCRGRNCYLFFARGWFVLSLHAESERICCSLEYWVLYHSLLLNFSNVGVHLWLWANPPYGNQLFAALEFRQSFCRLPTCMFNKCHRRFPDIHNIIF
jgi:hypothetical protein